MILNLFKNEFFLIAEHPVSCAINMCTLSGVHKECEGTDIYIRLHFKHMKQLLLHLPRTTEFRGPKQITVALVTRYNEWQLLLYNFVSIIPFLCRHGAPKSILSDQGREFVNSTNQTLFHLTGIKHKVTSAYHSQCNGLVVIQPDTSAIIAETC